MKTPNEAKGTVETMDGQPGPGEQLGPAGQEPIRRAYLTAVASDDFGPAGAILDLTEAGAADGLKKKILVEPTADQLRQHAAALA